ncbi:heavy-metal-associated domain-containing protein [Sphingomicrobium sediminis]|uniref:Heavy-metal-associated domain-containing protein n=1 Tax=Sphingomicrobium sediminis TaxID=2950949 RepID=A0A9X2J1Q3_9SPHN|nr:heavy-metal-associated domain-containing protein [Sphingomicrobium sediminis]MCM8556959.1 heavy-metal-associated domain-containing protein [Sphingomicrobium sediminis]
MKRFPRLLMVLLPLFALVGYAAAQMESGNRGILPRDNAQVFEVSGIEVDVAGTDPDDARYNGWRLAQREAFRRLWARNNGRPPSQAPSIGDAALDRLVSAVVVEREQIGPERYIATLGVEFDRARTASRLGVIGQRRRSPPFLLIPVTISGGTAMTVEQRNPWQRAWAELGTGDSAIDYVRVSGLGSDPLLVNAAVTRRPGTEWWTNVADLYGVTNILIAEVTLKRAYPGGPAEARFVAYAGRSREAIGSFTMTARNSEDVQRMMREAAVEMDRLYQRAFRRGDLRADRSIVIERAPETVETTAPPPAVYQVQIAAPSSAVLNGALLQLRSTPGVDQVTEMSLAAGGISSVLVTYRGEISALRAALLARGWSATYAGGVLRLQPAARAPLPPPPPPQAPIVEGEAQPEIGEPVPIEPRRVVRPNQRRNRR